MDETTAERDPYEPPLVQDVGEFADVTHGPVEWHLDGLFGLGPL
ncbi:lasso RiPP family leader peptide-containing protein [Goodfellowiella coeruleoviolacea]|uniref:Lasso RiPP family leader peptide-containing protein n=1 Tax=Goodfellowiella coeruleoviolacea TaxID=334858 RepID=A0AAE3GJI0_9PSEU|nr:lasso RiPP family leader peptide-containing protein [Goodfellowiella coeruleoviolacea]MCP2168678.1 hypothetical protein [Goodfellowiella coeruleoviolacea]